MRPLQSAARDIALEEAAVRADRGITARAAVIAMLLIGMLAAAGFAVEMDLNLCHNFNAESPPIAALGATVTILLLNVLFARRCQGRARRELPVIYVDRQAMATHLAG